MTVTSIIEKLEDMKLFKSVLIAVCAVVVLIGILYPFILAFTSPLADLVIAISVAIAFLILVVLGRRRE